MTALALNEVECNKTSEFLNTNSEFSEITEKNMKLAMAIDDDAMADSIETTELSNGYSELLNEKDCKDNYIPDTVQSDTIQCDTTQSDTTSQYDTARSENNIPLEDVEDNVSLKLRLSDDDEDVELDTSEKCESKITETIEESNQLDAVETSNTNQETISEGANQVTFSENPIAEQNTDLEININLDQMEVDNELHDEKITNSEDTTIENQDNTTTVNDILNDIENCLSENNKSLEKKIAVESTQIIEDTVSPNKIEETNNGKDIEDEPSIEISNVVSTPSENEIYAQTRDINSATDVMKQVRDEPEKIPFNDENVEDDLLKKNEETNDEVEKLDVKKTVNLDESVNLNTAADLNTDITDVTTKSKNSTINVGNDTTDENLKITTSTITDKEIECMEENSSRRISESFKRKLDGEPEESFDAKKLKTTEPTQLKVAANEDVKSKNIVKEKQIKTDEVDIKIKDENKSNLKDDKVEIKKRLILRVLPLLFENENIPDINIEELILTKIIEGITLRTELAALRQKAQSQEQLIDQLRRKATHLTKQLEDISTVTNRLTADLQNKDRPVAPVKITRSVGLQVAMSTGIGKRYSSLTNATNPIRKRPIPNAVNANLPTNNSSQSNANTATSLLKSAAPVANSSHKSPSLLNKALTKPTTLPRNTTLVVHPAPAKQLDTPAKQTKEKPPTDRPVTVDLTDEDLDSNKNSKNTVVSQTPPGLIPLTTGNIRMVSSLGSTMSTNSLTTQPQRVTYLMATPAGPGQNRQLLIATSAPTTGPRPSLTVVGQPNVRGAQGTRYLVNTNGQQAIVQRPGIVLTNGQASNAVRVPVRLNNSTNRTNGIANINRPVNPTIHPAPLPILLNQPHLPNWRQIPPRPSLKISRTKDGGIQLSWSMPELDQKVHEEVASYQLYAYQEGTAPPSTDLWRKVGDVKALPLPMACTLTSFHPGNKYYFAVRAIDVHSRVSQFSYAQPISLQN